MDQTDGNEIVRLARTLERLMARRRREQRRLNELDAAIRTTRKFLRDLVAPMGSAAAYGLLDGPLHGETREQLAP